MTGRSMLHPDVSTRTAAPLAHVVRGELVESLHRGHLVTLAPDGTPSLVLGDPGVTMWPRSTVKPLQAVAMVRHGLDLPERLLALAAASHNGEPEHLAGVREILAGVGLDEQALRNTPDLPWGTGARRDWLAAGRGEEPLAQNCSGKHAAMIATCVAAGWDREHYLDPDHPLQVAIRETIEEFAGVPVATATVDGCGAPLFSTTVTGLARAFARVAAAPERDPEAPEAKVARAMSVHPQMVAGGSRPTTTLMRAIPGLVAKDGADGVFVAAAGDGRAVAFKILDGSERPLAPVMVAALDDLGVLAGAEVDRDAVESLRERPVLGAGRPIGAIRAAF